jgi:aspartokinase-like uncharacterized kinase
VSAQRCGCLPVSDRLVVKIGGGLLREAGLDGLRRACAEAEALADAVAGGRPVLVVPGGGPFADAVRAVDDQVGLADGVAHILALRAMDQLGVLVRELMPAAELVSDLVAPRALGVLDVTPAFADRPEVPQSWAVTSDSLAVFAAAAIGADEAVLLKPVAGVMADWPSNADGWDPIPTLTAAELAALQARGGGRAVDAYLAEAVERTGVTVVVRAPSTVGTRITAR